MALVTKNFSDIITFSRASIGTYFDSAGVLQTATSGTPRFDYDPVTLVPRGFLIEEARTNLLLYSEQFDNAWWTKTRCSITANATTAPTGTAVADKLVEDTSVSASHPLISTTVTLSGTTVHSFSVFAKAAERTAVVLRINAGADNIYGSFNLSTGAVGAVVNSGTGSGATLNIQNVGNGWYRCTLTGICSSTSTTPTGVIYPAVSTTDPAGTSIIYTGDGTSGIFVFGAQLEAGAFPTSYIPTTAGTVLRNADVASVNTLSPWFNAAEGTLFVQGIIAGGTAATFPRMTTLVGSNPNNDDIGVVWGANVGSMRWAVRNGGVAQADITFVLPKSAGSSFKVAGRYAVNDFQAAFDGNLGTPDTSGTLPTITALSLGGPASFQPGANVWLQRVTFYPRGLSNAELQALTV